jgi:transcriptional regulator with XRE-family HTH domain
MSREHEISEFLVSRRARVQPDMVGLPAGSGQRRVPGLRREEVAQLSGLSTEYYIRLERGRLSSMSASVLNAVARALMLDDAERQHLFDLIGPDTATRKPAYRSPVRVRPSLLRLLEMMEGVPAMIQNHRTDVLAANNLGRALYPHLFSEPGRPANLARSIFLDPRAVDFYASWEQSARDNVAMLRLASGTHNDDRLLHELVGELSVQSPEFRSLWNEHDVRRHTTGLKTLHHPIVGDIEVTYESLATGDGDNTIVTYTVKPDSPAETALTLLASWSVPVPAHDERV